MKKLGNAIIQLMEELSKVSTNGNAEIKLNKNLADPKEFKQIFEYFKKGTVLERVELNVEPMETQINCVCGYKEVIDQSHNGYSECPECGRIADVDDREYELMEPNPEKSNSRPKIKF